MNAFIFFYDSFCLFAIFDFSFSHSVPLVSSICPLRRTVPVHTPVSQTVSTGHPLEAGLRNWMNMATHSMCLNTTMKRCWKELLTHQNLTSINTFFVINDS